MIAIQNVQCALRGLMKSGHNNKLPALPINTNMNADASSLPIRHSSSVADTIKKAHQDILQRPSTAQAQKHVYRLPDMPVSKQPENKSPDAEHTSTVNISQKLQSARLRLFHLHNQPTNDGNINEMSAIKKCLAKKTSFEDNNTSVSSNVMTNRYTAEDNTIPANNIATANMNPPITTNAGATTARNRPRIKITPRPPSADDSQASPDNADRRKHLAPYSTR